MTDMIKGELLEIGVAFYAGLCSMLIIDIKNLILSKITYSKIRYIVLNVFFYILIGSLIAEFLYYSTKGVVSIQGVISYLLGLLCWKKLLMKR